MLIVHWLVPVITDPCSLGRFIHCLVHGSVLLCLVLMGNSSYVCNFFARATAFLHSNGVLIHLGVFGLACTAVSSGQRALSQFFHSWARPCISCAQLGSCIRALVTRLPVWAKIGSLIVWAQMLLISHFPASWPSKEKAASERLSGLAACIPLAIFLLTKRL